MFPPFRTFSVVAIISAGWTYMFKPVAPQRLRACIFFLYRRNVINEWYIRDCSRKVTSVLRAKGMSGKHTTNHAIYGYRKDPDDPGHWLIDEEAAAVVRRIFQLTIEGNGPHQIARILTKEKVERPAYYLGQRNQGTCQSRDYSDERYIWQGTTVADMLTRPEYMGHTVNFRTYKESYKDKRPKKAPKEDWVIFENT